MSVEIENIGDYDTDEVVQFYIKDNSPLAVPNHSRGFKRIHLKKGESKVVEFTIRNRL